MNDFDKELYVAMVATATIIINYANDVAIVWDQLLQDYRFALKESVFITLSSEVAEV